MDKRKVESLLAMSKAELEAELRDAQSAIQTWRGKFDREPAAASVAANWDAYCHACGWRDAVRTAVYG